MLRIGAARGPPCPRILSQEPGLDERHDERLEREDEVRSMLVSLGAKSSTAEEKRVILELMGKGFSEGPALLNMTLELIERSEEQRLARRRLRAIDWLGPLGRIIAPRRRILGSYRRLLDELEVLCPRGEARRTKHVITPRAPAFLRVGQADASSAISCSVPSNSASESHSRSALSIPDLVSALLSQSQISVPFSPPECVHTMN